MKKNKILFLCPAFGYGGAERSIICVINGLCREKFEVGLCLLGNALTIKKAKYCFEALAKDVKLYFVPIKSQWRIEFFRALVKICSVAKKYDLLVSGIGLEPHGLFYLASRLTGKKLVAIIRFHMSSAEAAYVPSNKILINMISRWLEKHWIKSLDTIIAVSQGVKDDLVTQWRLKSEKIRVIYSPIDIEQIKSDCSAEVSNQFLSSEQYIITVGRLHPDKNHPMILRAFADIRKVMPVKLIIVGDGPSKQSLMQLSSSLGISEDVIFLGFQKNPYKYIFRSHVFVICSNHEGFCRVIPEAMVCGIPVISTDCPCGPQEIISQEINGLLIPVKDERALKNAVLRLLNDRVFKEKIRRGGFKRARDFDNEIIVKQYELLFSNCFV